MRQYPNPIIDGKRICPSCGQTKPVDAFGFNKTGKRAGHVRSYCKVCEAERGIERRLRTGQTKARRNSRPVIDGQKYCPNCMQNKPVEDYYARHGPREGELYDICKACKNRRVTECGHKSGRWRPMGTATDSAQYLGIHIAERVLSGFFDRIQRMPLNNPGFDFICGKGFKIDVKSSCLRAINGRGAPYWGFNIRGNSEADYFLCLAFDNREELNPHHVWLIPSERVKNLKNLIISCGPRSLKKWSEYERPLDRVISCCQKIAKQVSA